MELLKDITGALVTVDNGARINNLYMMDALPIGEGMRRQPRVLFPVPIVVEPFIALLSTGEPSYGPAVTVLGQREAMKVQEWNKTTGALQKLADEAITFAQADLNKRYSCVKIMLKDVNRGQMYAGSFVVVMITTTTTGGDASADEPGVTVDSQMPLTPAFISLSAQYEYDGHGRKLQCGDAAIMVKRDEVSQSLIEAASCFDITPMGSATQRYTLWGASSVKNEQTYDFMVYLKGLLYC